MHVKNIFFSKMIPISYVKNYLGFMMRILLFPASVT